MLFEEEQDSLSPVNFLCFIWAHSGALIITCWLVQVRAALQSYQVWL